MSLRKTGFSALTAYIQMGGAMVASLIMVRIATAYLSREEFGLWSFIFGSIGYLLLMDFGVSYAIGRMFADPIAKRDNNALSEWVLLSATILVVQGALIALVGISIKDPVLKWFLLPENLRAQAASLWIWCLILQGISLPLRILPAIIYAQNRVYWVNILSLFNAWLNLICFWFLLRNGHGVMSYAYAGVITLATTTLGNLLIVFLPKDRVSLCVVSFPFQHMKELFRYSSAMFIGSLAKQVSGASQVLIVTKLLGLDTAATFNVTLRFPQLGMSLLVKPYEAFSPRWILAWCEGREDKVRKEFSFMFRMTILAFGCGLVGGILTNPGFVRWWTRPTFFAGDTFNIWLCVSLLFSMVQQCMSFVFNMTKIMKAYTLVLLAGALVEIVLAVLFVVKFGLPGLPAATVSASVLFVLWFHLFVGLRLLGITRVKPMVMDATIIGLLGISSVFLEVGLISNHVDNNLAGLLLRIACSMVICLPLLGRAFVLFRNRPGT